VNRFSSYWPNLTLLLAAGGSFNQHSDLAEEVLKLEGGMTKAEIPFDALVKKLLWFCIRGIDFCRKAISVFIFLKNTT